jgi:hypothetical protein
MLWCSNDKVEIYFDIVPDVDIRYPVPCFFDDEEDYEELKKKPFINNEDLDVTIRDLEDGTTYNFIIEEGYPFDGASIPRFFWRLIGSNTDNTFLIPAMIHDKLCENHSWINYNKPLSTEVFNCMLEANKVNKFKRWMMKHSVNFYQNFCGWRKKK